MDIVGAIRGVERQLGEVVAPALQGQVLAAAPDDALLEAMAAAAAVLRQAEALIIEATGVVHERSSTGAPSEWVTTRRGCRSVAELVQRVTRCAARTAVMYERSARAVMPSRESLQGELLPPPYPAVREALAHGALGRDALNGLMLELEQAVPAVRGDDRDVVDASIAGAAMGDADAPPANADELRVLAQAWVLALCPDGAEPRERRALRGRGLTLGAARDGLVPLTGRLMPEVAAQVQRIFDALCNPKVASPAFVPTWQVASEDRETEGDGRGEGDGAGDGDIDGDGHVLRAATEQRDAMSPLCARDGHTECVDGLCVEVVERRTPAQRRHDAFATAMGVAARSGELPTIGGAAPTLVVQVSAADLANDAGYARLDGCDEPVSMRVARHVACAGSVQGVVVGRDGRILEIGVIDRVFNHHQRRAIALRDGGCVIPGCSVPAAWCEIHHVEEHARGGATHVDNGALLCWFHHRTLDTRGWVLAMRDGVPYVQGPPWWDHSRTWRRARGARHIARAWSSPGRASARTAERGRSP